MITYEPYAGGVRVNLDGKRVGVIVRIPIVRGEEAWQYQAGGRNKGEVFQSLEACKASLESDGDMTTFDKAQAMHDAFTIMSADLVKEGKKDVADGINEALLDVSDDSMALLYDIMQNVFNKQN